MAPAVIVGMESQDMATLMTEHLTNFLRISSLPSKCKLISRHGYRSLIVEGQSKIWVKKNVGEGLSTVLYP